MVNHMSSTTKYRKKCIYTFNKIDVTLFSKNYVHFPSLTINIIREYLSYTVISWSLGLTIVEA